jgi:predicted Zn-dependent protease
METALAPLRSDRKAFLTGRLETGEFYERVGLWEKARAMFDEVSRSDPAQRLLAEKRGIQAFVSAGRQSEALARAERTEKAFPKDKEVRFIRASLAVDRQEDPLSVEAVRELEQLRTDHEREPMYWYVLGQAYRRSGESEKAVAALHEAVRRNQQFEPALVALAELNLAGIRPDEGLRYAGEALALDSTNQRVRLLHARGLAFAGRRSEARSELASIKPDTPEFQDAQVELARLLLASKESVQAERLLRQLYRQGQPDLGVLETLAGLYLAAGDADRALALVDADLKTNSNRNAVRELEARIALAAN